MHADDSSNCAHPGYVSEEYEDYKPIEPASLEERKQAVLAEAKHHLEDEDHDHDSHSEEQEVEDVITNIEEVVYLDSEKVNMKSDVYSLTIAAYILNIYGDDGCYCSQSEFMYCLK